MKITDERFDLKGGLQNEWIITNGIGGYASSTKVGANTRKYHGLLVAALNPPAQRQVILSKIDEMIEIEGKKYDLYTNINRNYISKGYTYLEDFEKEYLPTYTYRIGNIEIQKVICMQYQKNTVAIYYTIKNKKHKAKITLAPLLNCRNYHYTMTNHEFKIKQSYQDDKLEVILDDNEAIPIYIKVSDSKYYEHENDSYKNMFYIEEEKRGFISEENHAIPGVFEVEIEPNEIKNISVVCTIEKDIDKVNAKQVIDNEIKRYNAIFEKSLLIDNNQKIKSRKQEDREDFLKQLMIASDNFIAYRPSFKSHTIMAGFHWFLDWSRDTMISFEGLLLAQNKFELAKEILKMFVRDIKYGLIPNGYSDIDNTPLYNSADASLLLFEQVEKYVEYTKDYEFIENNIYAKLKTIISHYTNGIDYSDNNIYLDSDGLIVAGKENTQNTWMDAKYDGKAVTPRNGKAVELNALWYNALMIASKLAIKFKEKEQSKIYEYLAEQCQRTFVTKFYNEKKKCLFDVIGDDKIRPNQLFALSLTYPIINPKSQIAKNIIDTVEDKLLTPYGLKTLAEGEENYTDKYEGNGYKRDTSYHQGITWVWLLGLYYNSLKNMIKAEDDKNERVILRAKLKEFKQDIERRFRKELYNNACIGGISELYDSVEPYKPGGTINQAWSVAEIFRIIK